MKTLMSLGFAAVISLLPCSVIWGNNIEINNYTFIDTTGQSTLVIGNDKVPSSPRNTRAKKSDCRKEGCNVYAEINKSEQMMYVYVSGELQHTFPVSTGRAGHSTPNLDLKPSGPTYEKYRSKKYPEGDYKGMGNMPYAVFLKGGYAIHGTTPGSIPKLGKPASHGCIRLHPDDAKIFYELVNSIGLENTWVTVRP